MSARYYCDMCKKEIINRADRYTVSVKPEDINSINLVDTYLCANCVRKLHELIKNCTLPTKKGEIKQ